MIQLNDPKEFNENYLNTRDRFDQDEVAQSYVLRKNNLDTYKNRREMSCIENALSGLPKGSKVLDLPCGSGRLELMLLNKGFDVTAADYSKPMLNTTAEYHHELLNNHPEKASRLTIDHQDILNTDYEDNSFDAVICNRLLHHYPEPDVRQKVLSELSRITKDRIIVSFFSNFSISALKFHLGKKLRGITPCDRIPIWFSTFKKDIEVSGLRIDGCYPVNYGFSPQTYLVLKK